MAETLNELVKLDGDVGQLIVNGTITRERLMKYLAVPEFNEQLQRIMPYIRSLSVGRLLEIVHDGADRDSINAIKMLEKGAQDAGKTGEYFFSGSTGSDGNSSGDNVLNVQVNISDVQQALAADPLINTDS